MRIAPNSNYSVLEKNVLDFLSTHEAQAAFLWACGRPGFDDPYLFKAEAFAREVEDIDDTLLQLLDTAACKYPEAIRDKFTLDKALDLWGFIMKRHANYRYPSQGKGDWVTELLKEAA